jgi:DNA-directed RNA polymerase beta subunit
MDDVRSKYSDIEINYRKIPVDRQLSEDECKLRRKKYSQPLFLFSDG